MYTCPVCYYTGMQDPPRDYNICECCGTEFGNDDEALSHEELRTRWIESGAKWYFRSAPVGWNPWTQLFTANVGVVLYFGAHGVYGGAELETAKTLYSANLGPFTYGGAFTMYGGTDPEIAKTLYPANLGALTYGGAFTMYGATEPETAKTIYAAQDVLARAA
jgi:hypothetical protein